MTAFFVFCGAAAAEEKGGGLYIAQWVTPNPVSEQDLTGHVFVVEFWATWCPPCMQSIPHMNALAAKYEDKNVIFLGLSQDRSIEDVQKVVAKKQIRYHIAMDGGTADQLHIQGIPLALIIGHDGKLAWAGHPGSPEFEMNLDMAVKAAPAAMLEGVDLGQFSHLRIALCGGKNFAAAYGKLQSHAAKVDDGNKPVASAVIKAVDEKIKARIAKAGELAKTDPSAGAKLYKEIIDNFGGIDLTKDLQKIYDGLLQQPADKNKQVAANQ
jgi:thiol-disulfide isomerase/thioredoxin